MRFEASILEYLRGERFSNALEVPASSPEAAVPGRMSYLEERVRGSKVIHLGCVDHLPIIEAKLAADTWLHSRLSRSAARCLGVDINPEGIEYLRSRLGYSDLACADLTRDEVAEIRRERWDFLVMGEILEHLDDPVGFLSAVRERYGDNIGRVIVTVPNAFSVENFRAALRHREVINSDHRFWFTPYTLAMVLRRSGLTAGEFRFCETDLPAAGGAKGLRRSISPTRRLWRRFPMLRSTLVMEASLR
jgi:hypothetical protein